MKSITINPTFSRRQFVGASLTAAAAAMLASRGTAFAAGSAAADATNVKDGTYTSTQTGMNDEVTITVTFAGGKITDVQATGQETEGIGSVALEEVPSAIVSAGTTEGVDGHAGASVTSTAIFDAVNSALASATA